MIENRREIERTLKELIVFDKLQLMVMDNFYKRVFYTLQRIVLLTAFPFAMLVGAILDFCIDICKKSKLKRQR